MKRAPRLQAMLDAFAEEHGIDQNFINSSDHKYSCICPNCKEWWRKMGPDEDGMFGPFGESLN